ncbi:hypothetical protein EOE67_16870 [Rheinheimera riviphila]|uniref:Uncharacterized protein n=1 Tax=Rheinheimera riviphila TaxID=1834037 RepID=A0A437QFS4_9GAMM|nr:hypothetical protein [Rheinheimera riviphila]RVU33395.1 hypothetical protein EOE67_16870 [Rheinheimera riviphila]
MSSLLSFSALAQTSTTSQLQNSTIAGQIPAALQPWQAWVLAKHPNHPCPWLDGEEQQCLWVGQTRIEASPAGAEFSINLQLFQQGWITLPGDVRHWPQEVVARNGMNEESTPAIRDLNGEPQIWLTDGNWRLTGKFDWQQAPEYLQIPTQSGILQLQWQQQKVAQPKRLGRQLWLQPSAQQSADLAQDQLQIQVFRLLEDHIPARLTTVLQLDVSGNSREIELSGALLPSFQALTLSSELPALLNADGQLRLQLQPGRFQVELVSQSFTPVANLTLPGAKAPWPDTEILAFAAAPELRTVRISGAPALDPNQTQAPQHWRQYPLYQLSAGGSLQLEQQSRGATQSQDQLQLSKTAWLNFNGDTLTVADTLSGELASSSRLSVMAPYQLGRAELSGEPQLITQLPPQQPGVELRQNPLQLTTVSTVPLSASMPATLPVSGWQARFSNVEMQLQLPPGWSLFTATGADEIYGGYIQNWTLWDIFFVLLLTTACGRMFGWPLALLAFSCMLLLYQRADAPQWLWLVLVSLLALLKIASGRVLTWLQRASQLCAVMLLLLLLPFAIDQIRLAIYPQLEKPWHSIQYQNSANTDEQQGASYERAERQATAKMAQQEVAAAPPVASVAGAMSSVAVNEYQKLSKNLAEPLPTPSFAQDPTARIQTGPARPEWQWQTVTLRWQGPVLAEEQTQLYLVPAWLNRLGSLVTVLLALAFWWLLSRQLWAVDWKVLAQKPAPGSVSVSIQSLLPTLLPALLLLAATLSPSPAFSQSLPNAELLAELEQRLLKRPECLPQCSSISKLHLSANDDQVIVMLTLHSQQDTAWPLPVALHLLSQITLGQSPATLYSEDEQHWLLLPRGQHQLELKLEVGNISQLNLQFAQPWHQLTSQLQGWSLSLDTTHADDLPALIESRKQLQLQRTSKIATQQRLDPSQSSIAPVAVLTRRLQLGLEWQLHSTLERQGQSNASLQIALPLLPGETPISKQTVLDGKIQLQLAPDQYSVSWVSRLAKTDQLQLKAQLPLTAEDSAAQPQLTEVWQLAAGPQWHISSTGIAAIADATSPMPQLWRPWPGEQLQLQISQPPAITGDTITIHRALLSQQQGKRSAELRLVLDITASTAQTYTLQLPAAAEVTELQADGDLLPAPASTLLQLPIRPGTQQLSINWQQPSDSFWQHQTPQLHLGQAAGNIYLQLQLPPDRWLWAVQGPAIGPAILFWGMLLVVLGLAVVLARVIASPLTKRHWLLLFAGISTVSLWIPVLIALWLFSLSKRGQLQQPPIGVKGRLQQLSLLLLSLTAVGALLLAIPYGLLSQPDMHLTGNGSYLQNLQWYQDAATGELPVATSWSLPLWCYQLAMLLWSLWLATALVRWLPWAWRQLSAGGFWPAPASVIMATPVIDAEQKIADDDLSGKK